MKKIKLSLIFAILMQSTAFSQDYEWAKQIGGTGSDQVRSITLDATGNIYTTGFFTGTADFDPGIGVFNLTSTGGSWDIFISKLDADGDFIWAKRMGGIGEDNGLSIAVDANGNVYTTGRFEETVDFDPGSGVFELTSTGGLGNWNIFISKLDSNGDFMWAKRMGGIIGDEARSITVDAGGNIYTTGRFEGTVDFDPGSGVFELTSAGILWNIFISKLDSNGDFVWAKRMSGGSGDGYSIATDVGGNVYTTGQFGGTVDFDPGSGVFNLPSAGGFDVFISKLDTDGNFLWAKSMEGTGEGLGIAIDADGNVYTTGGFQETVDFDPGVDTYNLSSNVIQDVFVSKLDTDGNFIWAKNMGGSDITNGSSITADNAGNVYTTGYFSGISDFDPGLGVSNLTSAGSFDIFISKLNKDGDFVWAKRIGATGNDPGWSISIDAIGNVYTAGGFQGTVDFDAGVATNNLISNGGQDIFIAKYSQSTLSIENLKDESKLVAYPTPTNSVLNIDITSSATTSANIKIVNLLGSTVAKHNLSTGNNSIDVSNLTKGVYFIQAENPTTDLEFSSVKFVKE